MNKMFQEFRDFAVKGNVVDMAVGVIIGAAFGKIVGSLVADILMPPIGRILGGVDFSGLFFALDGGTYKTLEEAKTAGIATLNYGLFINNIINFLIVSFCVFLLVKAINTAKKKEVQAPTDPPPPSKEVLVLQEIRDLLKH